MKFFIQVKANAKENKITPIDQNRFKITVKAPPQEGKANEMMLRVLAEHLNIPKSKLVLHSGHRSKSKVVTFLCE